VRTFTRFLIYGGVVLIVLIMLLRNTKPVHSTTPDSSSTPSLSSSVVSGPSLSGTFINRVLSVYHSPAVGLGPVLYTDSQQFHIDDAFALAFFLHESSFGTTGVARFTHSLGNIICAGYPTCLDGFRSYTSWQAGAWDWFHLIKDEYLQRGLTTVEKIVPVYAPASAGNVPAAYIAAVKHAVSVWHHDQIRI